MSTVLKKLVKFIYFTTRKMRPPRTKSTRVRIYAGLAGTLLFETLFQGANAFLTPRRLASSAGKCLNKTELIVLS
jgi:hypothetical protein